VSTKKKKRHSRLERRLRVLPRLRLQQVDFTGSLDKLRLFYNHFTSEEHSMESIFICMESSSKKRAKRRKPRQFSPKL
jgi:hypothetical protein